MHDLAFIQAHGVYDNVKKASKEWKYAPATCNGVPVPSEIYIAYTFHAVAAARRRRTPSQATLSQRQSSAGLGRLPYDRIPTRKIFAVIQKNA